MKTVTMTIKETAEELRELERSILGAVLLIGDDKDAAGEISDLTAEMMITEWGQAVLGAAKELIAEGEPVDMITVAGILRSAGQTGTAGRLAALASAACFSSGLGYRAKLYAERWADYKYRISIMRAAQHAQDHAVPVPDLGRVVIEAAQAMPEDGKTKTIKQVMAAELDAMQRRSRGEREDVTPTGFEGVDQYLGGGLRPAELTVIAARPGMGKTAIAINIAAQVAETGKRVLILSLEMTLTQLAQRLLASQARVQISNIRGAPNSSDYPKIGRAIEGLAKMKLELRDMAAPTIGEIQAVIRQEAQHKDGLDLVVLDYIQLARGSAESFTTREREIAEISAGLKTIAKQCGLSVIALAQLNRGVESRDDKRPRLSDLRESGSMEQDADQVLAVYRAGYYEKDKDQTGRRNSAEESELIILKNRSGETGTVNLDWHGSTVRFDNQRQERRY